MPRAFGGMRACQLAALLLAALFAGPARGTLQSSLRVAPFLAEAPRRCRGPPSGVRLPSLELAALWGRPPASNRTVTLVTQLSMDRLVAKGSEVLHAANEGRIACLQGPW